MRRYLLDTCAISDGRHPEVHPRLAEWLRTANLNALFISVGTLTEIVTGIEALARGKRRAEFERWFEHDLLAAYEGRILGVDVDLVYTWGRVRADAHKAGNNADELDILVAATARRYDLSIVTRNVKHFIGLGLAIESPW